ncbi:LysR family transcriptional regulator [Aliigemmobacter aestuarii]|uniref:LysR family transcriptional regulator n=1 Tax=Aliigemmobacter aestuarii TaxID=1445661 RepID=A0A4S3MKA1_9RHOB|nr:LysR substrate-binding domain-containing protein [Gemmobacter aestuarii]THD81453.1 LysR family transcriptional regulator [Gemmobacter aestuarii]
MLGRVTIQQLQTFREVMRTGSISEASRVLGRTQPAVSAVIANLEGQLGFALFLREHGRLTPCPEAHYLLEEAEDILERLARTTRSMAEFANRQRGSLRIACHPAASGFFVPSLLAGFLTDRPDVKADLMMRSSQVVTDLVASQEYDIGLAETPSARTSILSQSWDLECVLALPAENPFPADRPLTPQDLHDYPMATLFDDHSTNQATEAAFARAGATLNRRFVLRTFLPAIQLVAHGMCASLVDRITARSCPKAGIVFRAFDPAIRSSVAILEPAHRPQSLLAQAFRAELARQLDQLERWVPAA